MGKRPVEDPYSAFLKVSRLSASADVVAGLEAASAARKLAVQQQFVSDVWGIGFLFSCRQDSLNDS